jgi:hypothetical protein
MAGKDKQAWRQPEGGNERLEKYQNFSASLKNHITGCFALRM